MVAAARGYPAAAVLAVRGAGYRAVTCQDIRTRHTQAIVNAAPTAGEGDRVRRMISALVSAGLDGGYLANPRLAKVHWQAGDRPVPAPAVSVAGESALWVDPAEIPSHDDVARLGRALGAGVRGSRDELMANTAAYSGLRWGELAALTIAQVDLAARVIAVDRKVVEVGGHLYVEAPKNRKFRRTIYPRHTPAGYPLADRLADRIDGRAPSRRPGLTRSAWSSRRRRGSTGGRPTSAATSSSPPTLPRAGGTVDGDGRWTWHSPAARVLHHGAVHLEARRDRRVPDGRALQLPDHAGHVRRHHRRSPRPCAGCHGVTRLVLEHARRTGPLENGKQPVARTPASKAGEW